MTDAVYLIPSDTSDTSEDPRLLSDEELKPKAHGSLQANAHDAIKQAAAIFVTHLKCPVHIVNKILSFADAFTDASIAFRHETSQRMYGSENMDEVYLRLDIPSKHQLTIPTGFCLSNCVQLIVDCTSKDQGWASADRHFNGTYNGSCTWSEVVVQKPRFDSNNFASNSRPDQHEACAGSSSERDEEKRKRTLEELTRKRVCYNVRATDEFRHHRRVFHDPNGLVKHIQVGCSVALVLRSAYPGWRNSAVYGRLEAAFAVELSPDFATSHSTSFHVSMFDFCNPEFPNTCHQQ